jgi:hypothetical protein
MDEKAAKEATLSYRATRSRQTHSNIFADSSVSGVLLARENSQRSELRRDAPPCTFCLSVAIRKKEIDPMAKLPTPRFTLGQLIEQTAAELRELQKKPQQDAVMQFTNCELELAVTISAELGGGIKFTLIDFSAKGSAENASKVKLSFGPLTDKIIVASALGTDNTGPPATRKSKKGPQAPRT